MQPLPGQTYHSYMIELLVGLQPPASTLPRRTCVVLSGGLNENDKSPAVLFVNDCAVTHATPSHHCTSPAKMVRPALQMGTTGLSQLVVSTCIEPIDRGDGHVSWNQPAPVVLLLIQP